MTLAIEKPLHIPTAYGDVPNGWNWARLDEVTEGVFDCPHSTPKLTESGPFVVRTQDIITGHVSEETYAERTIRAMPSFGDPLYSREGTYFGIAAEVPQDTRVCLGQRMVLIRPDSHRLDFRFLRYWLNSPLMAAHIRGFRDGTVAERLNRPTLRALPVLLPPLPEQKAIAAVLGTLDDKIELNRRMSATLEAMARAPCQSWFVDFDPVRAKAEGRSPAGLDEATAALFPDSFQDSELGEIPQGWRVMKFEGFIKRLPVGRKYDQKTVFPSGKVPVFDQGKSEIIGFHDNEPGVEATLDKPVAVFANHTCYMRLITYSFSAIQNVLPFIGSGVDTFWAYYATEGRLALSEYKGHWPDFVIQKSVVPPLEVTGAFGMLAKPIVAQMRNNEEQSRTLAAVRDTLLPKLLSGELNFSQAAVTT